MGRMRVNAKKGARGLTAYANGKKDEDEVCLRKARGDETRLSLDSAEVTPKGDGGKYSLATWQKDGFSYSLSSATPLPRGA